MVERSLSMREVPGSIPGTSKYFCSNSWENSTASSGNRTRAARVAGKHSTTEPTMPHTFYSVENTFPLESVGLNPTSYDPFCEESLLCDYRHPVKCARVAQSEER